MLCKRVAPQQYILGVANPEAKQSTHSLTYSLIFFDKWKEKIIISLINHYMSKALKRPFITDGISYLLMQAFILRYVYMIR